MILKILSGLFLSVFASAAVFQYGGIKHDITNQVGTASPIIMNAASTQVQRITGSTAQTIRLPDATTLRSGYWYTLVNENSSAVTVQNSSSFTLGTLSGGSAASPTYATLYITSNSTSGGPWTFQKDQSAGLSPSGVTPGSYTSANITVDTNGIVTAASNGSGGSSFSQHDIYLENGLGHGSTNTKVRTFSNVRRNTGTNLTLTQSATLGDSMTVNTAGAYLFCYSDFISGSASHTAITVNGTALTTNVSTPLTYAQGKRDMLVGVTTSETTPSCWFGILAVNDVVRTQDDGTNSDTSSRSYFFGSYLGDGDSSAYLENGLGNGSTNTTVRTFSNSRGTTGSDITVTQSATLGDSFTVNANGLYAGCYSDGRATSNTSVAISVNGSALTTNAQSLTYAQGLRAYSESVGTNYQNKICFIGYLSSGDVVRAQDGTLADQTNSQSYFYLTELSSGTSGIFLNTGAGHGTTSTKVRTFTNLRQNTGNDMTYRRSAIFGDSVKINTEGQYAVCYSDSRSGGGTTSAITVNGEDVTVNASTPIDYQSQGKRGLSVGGANGDLMQTCYSSYLYPGDILRAVDDGSNTFSNDQVVFSIVKTR